VPAEGRRGGTEGSRREHRRRLDGLRRQGRAAVPGRAVNGGMRSAVQRSGVGDRPLLRQRGARRAAARCYLRGSRCDLPELELHGDVRTPSRLSNFVRCGAVLRREHARLRPHHAGRCSLHRERAMHATVRLPNVRLRGAPGRWRCLPWRHGLRKRCLPHAGDGLGCLRRATKQCGPLFPRPRLFQRRMSGKQPRAADLWRTDVRRRTLCRRRAVCKRHMRDTRGGRRSHLRSAVVRRDLAPARPPTNRGGVSRGQLTYGRAWDGGDPRHVSRRTVPAADDHVALWGTK